MRQLVSWTDDKDLGHGESFGQNQTAQQFAEQFAHRLVYPGFLSDEGYYAMGAWALPEGVEFDDVPPNGIARRNYMRCIGRHDAMTVELRTTHPDGSFEHYTVAREPITNPSQWTQVSFNTGDPEPHTIPVHPEELFTGQQAVPVLNNYILNATTPPPHLLRQVNTPTTTRQVATWTVHKQRGRKTPFTLEETAQQTAQKMAHRLTDPSFLSDHAYFATGAWALPPGVHYYNVSYDDPARDNYIQCAGTYQALTIEIRTTEPNGSYKHYTVAREPVTNPNHWTQLTINNGDPKGIVVDLHPEELFTGPQAAQVFTPYILNATLPPPHLLRQTDV